VEYSDEEIKKLDWKTNPTMEEWRAMNRYGIGWDELREDVRQIVRDEVSRQLQAVLGSLLDKSRGAASAS
jgi:hypothetical protein